MNNIIDNYDLFIFDLDNAVIETEEYHYKAWLLTLQNILGENFIISFNYFCEKFHSKDSESIKKYLTNNLNIENYDEVISYKNINYLNILSKEKNNLKLIDGLENFINLVIKNNKKFIIVSNSFKNNIDFFLNIFSILNNSSNYYYREMFKNKKPSTECYLKVINDFPNMRRIGFEYNITGIHALSQVNEITTVFVNNSKYIHYNFIIKNYANIIIINDYNKLNNYYIENKIINTLRTISVDMVDKANSGHPGMPLGCAPMMYVLWCKIMNFNPENPLWIERDRFILSNGHGCALLYSMLYLLGYNYTLDDLKNFRQLHSKTPGHPEFNQLLGIECSTGPLGQGIANGVGMAIASKKMKINNNIFVMCGDGCLMEGISYESASLAGHLGLNNLIVLYDDNEITIDGSTDITFTENVRDRFRALNWNILEVKNGDKDINDIYEKLNIAKKSIDKPTIIFVKTTIGYGASNSGCSSVHGAPLGVENTKSLKKYFNFDENKSFFVDDDVTEYFQNLKKDKKIYYEQFDKGLYDMNNCDNKSNCIRELSNIRNDVKNYATRDISNILLNILVKNTENIIVGSADLSESNKTSILSDFLRKDNFDGKYLHYGIREHAMASIANGISTYGLLPVVSTFLVFITYCLASIRMASLSKHKVLYILTHDSVFLGEDGPTHQPIESLSILRSIPNLLTIRPCDVNESSGAYQISIENNGPTALILSRQVLPNIENSSMDKMKNGGYIIYESSKNIKLILISTGSEVSLAIEVAKKLADIISIRVVSMPCTQLFDIQSTEYKNEILPKNITKISIEAGSTFGWYKYADYCYGIDTFGESAKIVDIKEYFGFNVDKVINFIEKNIIF
jgi:transketolase